MAFLNSLLAHWEPLSQRMRIPLIWSGVGRSSSAQTRGLAP